MCIFTYFSIEKNKSAENVNIHIFLNKKSAETHVYISK